MRHPRRLLLPSPQKAARGPLAKAPAQAPLPGRAPAPLVLLGGLPQTVVPRAQSAPAAQLPPQPDLAAHPPLSFAVLAAQLQ
jgi:hypothetical protein